MCVVSIRAIKRRYPNWPYYVIMIKYQHKAVSKGKAVSRLARGRLGSS